MSDVVFEIPTSEYFKFGNVFSASKDNFNYKIFPELEKGKARVAVFMGNLCYEKSEILFEKYFELAEGFVKDICLWLSGKYFELC